jgi:Pregnancy-associated plasma protein-A
MQGTDLNCLLFYTSFTITRHWLGLLHLNGNEGGSPCSPSDQGDYVDDTPKQMLTYGICPGGVMPTVDTCAGQPGLDSLENFMSYSTDSCKTSFSPGQVNRMYAQWLIYRAAAKKVCKTDEWHFLLDMNKDYSLARYDINVYFYLENAAGEIIYNSELDSGYFSFDICLPKSTSYGFMALAEYPSELPTAANRLTYMKVYLNGRAWAANVDFTHFKAWKLAVPVTKTPTRTHTKPPTATTTLSAKIPQTPSKAPTRGVSRMPTRTPSKAPTRGVSGMPTRIPSKSPTRVVTRMPTRIRS